MTRSRPRPWCGGTGDATPRAGDPPGRRGPDGVLVEHAAEGHDAALIALGRRRPGIGGRANQALRGSLAAHLLHSQHRPVRVIPPPGPDRATEDG